MGTRNASAGRRPKPTAVHELHGTKPRAAGVRGEPKVEVIAADAPPPAWIVRNRHAVAGWQEMVPLLSGMKVASVADKMAIGLLCEAFGRFLTARQPVRRERAWAQVRSMLTEFGLTPAARAKVTSITDTFEDPFDAWQASADGPLN